MHSASTQLKHLKTSHKQALAQQRQIVKVLTSLSFHFLKIIQDYATFSFEAIRNFSVGSNTKSLGQFPSVDVCSTNVSSPEF